MTDRKGMSVLFNGVDLSQWIVITGIDIQDLPTTTPNAIDVGVSPGQTLLSDKFGPRTITLTYYLIDAKYKHDLAGALGSSNNQPAQLILGNDPDKYYMAVPAGGDSQDLGPVVGLVSGGSLTFVCYDPFIYDTNTVTATNKSSSSDNQLLGTSIPYVITGTDKDSVSDDAYAGTEVTSNKWQIAFDVSFSGGTGVFLLMSKYDYKIISQIYCNGQSQHFNQAYEFSDGTPEKIDLWGEINGVPSGDIVTITNAKAVALDDTNGLQPDMTWSPAAGEDGYASNAITITNPGSADAPIDLTAEMTDDVGYLAATINGSGVSLGNPNGQATPDGDVSTKMFETYFWSPYALTQNKYPGKVSSTASLKGSWAQANWEGVGYVYPNNYAEPSGASGQALYGTSFYMPFDQPRNHWSVNYHMFNYPLKNQVLGYTEMFAVDSAGALIFGYQFRKLNWANKYQQLILWIGDDVINTWTDEQHTSWIMEQFTGNLQLEQDGDAFTFRFNNGYTKAPWAKTLVYSNLTNQQCAGINFYTGKFGGCDGFQTHVMGMVGTSYDTNWVQTNNLFQQNSTVEIDSDASAPSVLVNGIPALDTMVPTSQPLIVPANSTAQIDIDNTIGKQIPSVTATLRPRYI